MSSRGRFGSCHVGLEKSLIDNLGQSNSSVMTQETADAARRVTELITERRGRSVDLSGEKRDGFGRLKWSDNYCAN